MFPPVVPELAAVGVGWVLGVLVGAGVWIAWSAGFPCCWTYTEAGIEPGPATVVGLGAPVVEPVPGVVVAAYGVIQ